MRAVKRGPWKSRIRSDLPQPPARSRTLRWAEHPRSTWNHIVVAEEVNRLHQAGVGVQIGAHGQREGLGVHWEILSMVQGGRSRHEALRCGSLGDARWLSDVLTSERRSASEEILRARFLMHGASDSSSERPAIRMWISP